MSNRGGGCNINVMYTNNLKRFGFIINPIVPDKELVLTKEIQGSQ